MRKVLFVTSEVHPLIKTGGLADVSGSLPKALLALSQDVRIVMPHYHGIKTDQDIHFVSSIRVYNQEVNILDTRLPGTDVPVWLVDFPEYFGHAGNPYLDDLGHPWENIAERFSLFCRIAVEIAMDRAHLNWRADLVHCNDWQSGLVPALLKLEHERPKTVFTIHNLAYQGLFPNHIFQTLKLPPELWSPEAVEFHGMLSFIKGGLACADHITTVSPTYAREIQTPEYGYGLEGLLNHRSDVLSGIINGIDLDVWNPQTDAHIAENYSSTNLAKKLNNKTALQAQASLPTDVNIPVIGLISRLVEQKGIDLVLSCLADMAALPMQFILLGSGDKTFEHGLLTLAENHPEKITVTLGYDEHLAHLIEAGSDIFLMPSRFEPCGLNQMYSQRYGTLPIVRKTGGLADTVVDALPSTVQNKTATGFVFQEASSGALFETIKRALLIYNDTKTWRTMQKTAMQMDFSWENSARHYLALYDSL